jgi:hypothetical protein
MTQQQQQQQRISITISGGIMQQYWQDTAA